MKKKLLAIPICALVLVCGFMITAKAKRSNAAADGLTQNELSADGFRREDLKAVYRDITTNRFANDKTAEVIKRSVSGVEILQEVPAPGESADWQNGSAPNFVDANPVGIDYFAWTKWKYDETLDNDIFDKSIVDCYDSGETIWSTEISSFCVHDCTLTENGTAAWGYTRTWSSEQPSPAWIARLDSSGNKLWERQLDHGFKYESICAVLDNGDGTWEVFSFGDIDYLCAAKYDINGNELAFKKTMVGNEIIRNAIRLEDGYLLQFDNCINDNSLHLVKLDRAGNVIDNFVYKSDECDYKIMDMTEFGGNVYLSAYAVPKKTTEIYGGIYEIDTILSHASDEGLNEDLTSVLQNSYTAVLLLCDPDGGEPKTFYSVKGALGGKLAVEDDQLKWNAESLVYAFFSPYTSSFSIGGTCRIYRYSFDGSGAITGCEDTGEFTHYIR